MPIIFVVDEDCAHVQGDQQIMYVSQLWLQFWPPWWHHDGGTTYIKSTYHYWEFWTSLKLLLHQNSDCWPANFFMASESFKYLFLWCRRVLNICFILWCRRVSNICFMVPDSIEYFFWCRRVLNLSDYGELLQHPILNISRSGYWTSWYITRASFDNLVISPGCGHFSIKIYTFMFLMWEESLIYIEEVCSNQVGVDIYWFDTIPSSPLPLLKYISLRVWTSSWRTFGYFVKRNARTRRDCIF